MPTTRLVHVKELINMATEEFSLTARVFIAQTRVLQREEFARVLRSINFYFYNI